MEWVVVVVFGVWNWGAVGVLCVLFSYDICGRGLCECVSTRIDVDTMGIFRLVRLLYSICFTTLFVFYVCNYIKEWKRGYLKSTEGEGWAFWR